MQCNFSRIVGKTEHPHLHYLLYADAFANCTNWLVKSTTGGSMGPKYALHLLLSKNQQNFNNSATMEDAVN